MKRQLVMLAGALMLAAFFTTETFAAEITVRGRLGRTVEARGWLILTDSEKYLILNPQRFQNETWFRESTEVEATGEVKPDALTIYQEGTPFEVRSMRPVGGGGGGGDGASSRQRTSAPGCSERLGEFHLCSLPCATDSRRPRQGCGWWHRPLRRH